MTSITAPAAATRTVPSHRKPRGHGRWGSFIDAICVLVFIAGVVALVWPFAAAQVSTWQANQHIYTQQHATSALSDTQRAAELAKAVAYNDSLTGNPVTDPFIPGTGTAVPTEDVYMAALNVNHDGIMGTIDVDMLDIHLPIAHDTNTDVLQYAAGHIRQSSLPIGGPGTHAVIAAHRGLVNAEMFTRLNEMKIGDTFTITVLNEVHTYQVDQVSVVEPDDLSKTAIESGRDLVTLMTCTPYGVNTQRLLVRGTRINPNDTADIQTRNSWGIEHLVRVACAVVGLILIIWLVIWMVRRRQRES